METLGEGASLAGRYLVISVMEERDYRTIYLARDTVHHRQWVIKQFEIPSDDDQKRELLNHFYAEGARQSEIMIPQLPRVEEFFAERGCVWTVTEQIRGKTLEECRAESPDGLAEAQVKAWAGTVAEALRFLHGQEPRMVLGGFDREEFVVTENGDLRLCDYGLARILPSSRRGVIPPEGLPRWYDSDMLRNAKATRQADIWSLGALCYYALTGIDARHEGRKALSTVCPKVSDAFAAVVEKCLEPFGDRVYHSIEEVIDDLSGRQVSERRVPPRLAVDPPVLDFPTVSEGAVALERFKVVNEGGGTLAGHVHSGVPWLQVSPQHFEGNEQEVQVWLDTSMLHEDTSAKGHIVVTSANEELRIPVTVQLALGKVGGLPPKVGAMLMVVLALVPLGALGWFTVDALQTAAALQAAQGSVPTMPQNDPAWVALRGRGTLLLSLRFVATLLVPLLVFGVWQSLASGARRRTTLVALVTMLTPALLALIGGRASEGTFAVTPLATWLHLAPSLGSSLCIGTALMATVLLITPGPRYPLFFGQSLGLRILLWAVLLGLYFVNAYSMVVR